MPPSKITKRSLRSARNASARFVAAWTQTQGVTNGVRELGSIQGIEMELVNAVLAQSLHLFDGHVRSNHAAGFRIVIQSVESFPQPARHGCTAALGKTQQLRKARDRQDPGNEIRVNARGHASIAIAQEDVRVEEELGDGAAGTRVHFAF
jgi:hypothetical protein